MRSLHAVTIGLLAAMSLHAADVSGIWLGSLQAGGQRKQTQDVAFQFVQKGAALTGKLYVDYGSVPITNGKIEGDQITFQASAREQSGNEINQVVLRFTGTIKDGEIEISRERDEIRAAGNAGAGYVKPGAVTFRIKRLP